MATTYKGIAIPTSARGLELYSSKRGAGAAAQDILRQLKADITRLQKEGKGVSSVPAMAKLIGKIYNAGVYQKMLEHSQFGATDTEPRYHVGQALVDAAKRMMGIDYYCEDLGGWL